MTPAAAYLRVSGKGQLLDDADGFPRQRAAIAAFAQANGFEVVRTFEERGVSGTTDFEDRPAWVDLIAELQPGQAIIIERLDRLARDLGVQEYILRDLKKRGISIYSTAEPDLASADPTRILFRQILGAVASYDRALIEAKLRHARERQRKKSGRCEGRKPFGHRPEERETLNQIIRMRDSGVTTRAIAGQLNAAGLRTRAGGQWHRSTVAKIIRARGVAPHAETAPESLGPSVQFAFGSPAPGA